MKKFAIACAVVLACILTSCAPKESCNLLTYDIFGVQIQGYVYGDDTYLEAAIADLEAMYPGVTITAEKVDKAEADCIDSVE